MPDSYVLLPETRVAVDAVERAWSERSAAAVVSPVTVCGPSGSGKTALVKYLRSRSHNGSEQRRKKEREVVVQTGLEWADAFRRADRDGATSDWLHRCHQVQTLLIDGADVIARQPTVSDQFAAAIDSIVGRGGCVILTVSSLPGRQHGFSRRIADRIRGGTVATIQALSDKSVGTLIGHFAGMRQMPIDADAVDRLIEFAGRTAGQVQRTVSELERLTIRRASGITVGIVGEWLRQQHGHGPSIPQIAKAVAREFSARVSDLRAPGRSQSVVVPRQTAMFLAREIAGEHYQAIGDYFGRRNHSTVLHSVRRVEQMLDASPEFASRVVQIRSSLGYPS